MVSVSDKSSEVYGEGRDLYAAIEAVAEQLGVQPERVGYEYDLAHFRSSAGTSMPRKTVKIKGWVVEGASSESTKPKKSRKAEETSTEEVLEVAPVEVEAVEDDVTDEVSAAPQESAAEEEEAPEHVSEPEEEEPAKEMTQEEVGELTEAAEYAHEWFMTVLGNMDLTAKIIAGQKENRIRLYIQAEKAGRIIGRRGFTLSALRHLLGLALKKFDDELIVDVDVADGRGGGKERKGNARNDRGRRDSRDSRDSRDRRDRRDSRDSRGDSRGSDRGRYPADKLVALAQKAAQKALETQMRVTINLELNSHDRRIVHLEIAEIEGVSSESDVKSGKKYIQILPES